MEISPLVPEKIFERVFLGHVTKMLRTNFRSHYRWRSTQSLALIGQAVWEKKMFEIVDDGRTTDGRAPVHGYTISSPGEPSAQVS